ncbi:MAG: hypothetical protein KIS66_09925 [Fimbriimonadaceae bacterium]|nr:hypothetical protein [Fimbriimonadaceae bacterium]
MKRLPELAIMVAGLATALYFSFGYKVRVSDLAGEATADDRALLRVWAIHLAAAVFFAGVVLWAFRTPHSKPERRVRRLWLVGIASLLGVFVMGAALTVADTAKAVAESGFTEDVAKRDYRGDTEANLKALYVAAKLFHDSEERFPKSSEWMDAIASRIRTNDLTEEEAAKKLANPDLAKASNEYGFAMNDAASERFADDLPADTVLFFESRDLARNAHGDPATDARQPARAEGDLAITVKGTIVRL